MDFRFDGGWTCRGIHCQDGNHWKCHPRKTNHWNLQAWTGGVFLKALPPQEDVF
jgi:hypothetical protein